MERSWSDAARAALDAYPWKNPADKARAAREAELVSFGKAVEESELVAFGERVEVDDLPLGVRQWLRRNASGKARYEWHGESWKELTEGFERAILAQALAASGGNLAATARALKTTPRIVAYKAKKYELKV